jgi:hypothetical protein
MQRILPIQSSRDTDPQRLGIGVAAELTVNLLRSRILY